MNIKHISITAAGNVTAVIPPDLPVTLGLHRPRDENYLLERVRRLGDAPIQSDSDPAPTLLLTHDASLWASQLTNMSVCADV